MRLRAISHFRDVIISARFSPQVIGLSFERHAAIATRRHAIVAVIFTPRRSLYAPQQQFQRLLLPLVAGV